MGKLSKKYFTSKEREEIVNLFKENFNFIKDIVSEYPHDHEEVEDGEVSPKKPLVNLPARLCPAKKGGKKPARTIEELQEKLQGLKGKSNLAYNDKLVKKGLKNRITKREKGEKRRLRRAEFKTQRQNNKVVTPTSEQPSKKPVFNSEGQMVFSKFDFSNLGAKSGKPPKKGIIKDPAVKLKKVMEQEQRLKQMEESGLKDEVKEMRETHAWKSVLLKSEGVKVKDNPELLKATIKKTKKKKEKSEARWKANQERVEKEKAEKQTKRMANIKARAKEKKLNKLKRLSKKGRIIAGF